MIKLLIITLFKYLLLKSKIYPYIDPEIGSSIISVLIGYIVYIVVIFFAIIWFPIKKKLLKKILII